MNAPAPVPGDRDEVPAPLRRGTGRGAGPVYDLPRPQDGGFGWPGRLRSAGRLALFLGWTLLLIPVQVLLLRLPGAAKTRFPTLFHRVLCRLLGFRVVRHGVPVPDGAVLYVVNHSSWIDIPVLSACTPLSFVAKSEVEAWPLFGLLARLQRTVFVERGRRTQAARHRDAIAERLRAGDSLVLFAEGTSSDGNRVLPFKSSLLSAAEAKVTGADGTERQVTVQPVAVAYTGLNGIPMGRDLRPFFAWYGDMEMGPHLWQALQFGPLKVDVVFLEPLSLQAAGSRKALARRCEEAVAAGLGGALRGRPQGWTPGSPTSTLTSDAAPAGTTPVL